VSWPLALGIALLAGVLLAAQAPINAQVARHTSPLAAAAFSTSTSASVLLALTLLTGHGRSLGGLARTPAVYLTGGLLGVVVVTGSLVAVRVLGATGQVAAMVAMQISTAVALDRLGLLGLSSIAFTPRRVAGVALLAAGTALVTWR